MADYINKEDILKEIEKLKTFCLSEKEKEVDYEKQLILVGNDNILTAIEDILSDIPSVDVTPTKYGKWKWNPNGVDWGLGAWQCSECGCRNHNLPMDNTINPLVFSGSKYCPSCGVKMNCKE